jgi:hypothetical protein
MRKQRSLPDDMANGSSVPIAVFKLDDKPNGSPGTARNGSPIRRTPHCISRAKSARKQPRHTATLRLIATVPSLACWRLPSAIRRSPSAIGPCHPDVEAAVDEWISDHCVLDPDAWTPRPAMLASTTGWERFDADELTCALEARALSYRRRGNVHGFDGLRLKDEVDDE